MKHWVFFYLVFLKWCMHIIFISSLLHYCYIILRKATIFSFTIQCYIFCELTIIYMLRSIFLSFSCPFFSLGWFYYMQAITYHNQCKEKIIYIIKSLMIRIAKQGGVSNFSYFYLYFLCKHNIISRFNSIIFIKGWIYCHLKVVPLRKFHLCATYINILIVFSRFMLGTPRQLLPPHKGSNGESCLI